MSTEMMASFAYNSPYKNSRHGHDPCDPVIATACHATATSPATPPPDVRVPMSACHGFRNPGWNGASADGNYRLDLMGAFGDPVVPKKRAGALETTRSNT